MGLLSGILVVFIIFLFARNFFQINKQNNPPVAPEATSGIHILLTSSGLTTATSINTLKNIAVEAITIPNTNGQTTFLYFLLFWLKAKDTAVEETNPPKKPVKLIPRFAPKSLIPKYAKNEIADIKTTISQIT